MLGASDTADTARRGQAGIVDSRSRRQPSGAC